MDLDAPRRTVKRFRTALLNWWAANRRDFPWRDESDPYRILIAEMLLRRTQARQAASAYEAFILKFPSPEALASGSPHEIRRILRPLGLRWRTDNVIALSRVFAQEGRQALSPDRLSRLPGVGDYVAAAVRCFAYGEPVGIVDTNTARVACRLFGLAPTSEARRDPTVHTALAMLLDTRRARDFNLALIDFGASVCGPVRPLCRSCPVKEFCKHGIGMLHDGSSARKGS